MVTDKMGGGRHWPMCRAIRSHRRMPDDYYHWKIKARTKAKAILYGSVLLSSVLLKYPLKVQMLVVQTLAEELLWIKIDSVRQRQLGRLEAAIHKFNQHQLPYVSVNHNYDQIQFSWLFE